MTTLSSPMLPSEQPVATALARLSPPVRDEILHLATLIEVAAGATVLREGVDTPFLGILEAGRIALRLRVPGQREPLTFVTIEPGEIIGWSAVVDPYRATVDAVATSDSRILALDATTLRATIAQDPGLAAELLPLVLESVSARLTASWSQLLDLFAGTEPQPW